MQNSKKSGLNLAAAGFALMAAVSYGLLLIFLNEGKTSPVGLVLRYAVLPGIGLWIGIALAHNKRAIAWLNERLCTGASDGRLVAVSIALYCLVFFVLKTLKSISLNYEFFDAGLYVNKLWRIAEGSWEERFRIALVEGHFQPAMIIYGLLYGIFKSPLVPYFFETCALASGAIPVYLLARSKLPGRSSPLLIALAYLLSPLVQFNDILGFHPDHIVLPLLLWAFYFAETGHYASSIAALVCLSLSSEPWILSASAFGFYLWLKHGRFRLGIGVAAGFLIIFLTILFWLLPKMGSTNAGPQVFDPSGNASPYRFLFSGEPAEFLKLLMEPRKAFFIFFLFFPFLFIPLRAWSTLIVALPDFAKTLGSSEMLHYAVEGHYTLGAVAVVFVAYINALKTIDMKLKFLTAMNLPLMAVCLTFVLSMAHSPLPISFNFWSQWSGGAFRYQNYWFSDRFASLKKAESLMGEDPGQSLEISNGAFTPNVARREHMTLFPSQRWIYSDYILLDFERGSGAGSESRQKEYNSDYIEARRTLPNHFELIFDDPHVQLWRRVPETSLGRPQ
jgi:uncharacterized membrane protein